jgi:hypothetical protein
MTAGLNLKRAPIRLQPGRLQRALRREIGGRIFLAVTSRGTAWMWKLAYGQHDDHTPTHGYEPTREAAMAAFAKSWRR